MRINLAPEFTLDARQRKDVAAEDVGLRSIAINRIWDARNAKYRKPGNMQSGEAPSVAISNPTERKMWVRIDRALKTALADRLSSLSGAELVAIERAMARVNDLLQTPMVSA